ncbi:hypothetical protein CPC08DRAFT_391828 [Agrocybe pediades]|nr:hypothetical protein CPC08DRAFT_391828 [Agrocybe pediades]
MMLDVHWTLCSSGKRTRSLHDFRARLWLGINLWLFASFLDGQSWRTNWRKKYTLLGLHHKATLRFIFVLAISDACLLLVAITRIAFFLRPSWFGAISLQARGHNYISVKYCRPSVGLCPNAALGDNFESSLAHTHARLPTRDCYGTRHKCPGRPFRKDSR